jgi:hypothetical protein
LTLQFFSYSLRVFQFIELQFDVTSLAPQRLSLSPLKPPRGVVASHQQQKQQQQQQKLLSSSTTATIKPSSKLDGGKLNGGLSVSCGNGTGGSSDKNRSSRSGIGGGSGGVGGHGFGAPGVHLVGASVRTYLLEKVSLKTSTDAVFLKGSSEINPCILENMPELIPVAQ